MREKHGSDKNVAQPRVVRENEEWVRRLARSLVFDSNRAEDIVQQTWLELFKRPPQRGGNLRGWLTVVVKNVARKMKRSDRNREKREKRTAREEALELPVAGKQDKDNLQGNILRAVEALDEPYRSTVRMRYFEELAPQEIAERTGAPLDTVYTRLRRGLNQLRAKLDKQYGDRSLWIGIAIRLLPASEVTGPATALRPATHLRSYGSMAAGAAAAVILISGATLLIAVPSTAPETEETARTQTPVAEAFDESVAARRAIDETQNPVRPEILPAGETLETKGEISQPLETTESIEGAKPGKDPNRRIPERATAGSKKASDAPPDPDSQVKNMPKGGANHSQKKFQTNMGKGLNKPGNQ